MTLLEFHPSGIMVFWFLKIVKKLKLSIINSSLCLLKKILIKATMPNLGKGFPTMPSIDISVNGIKKLLTDLKPNKATRPDNIPRRILKMGTHEVAPALATIFRKSLETGSLPDDWRTFLQSSRKGNAPNQAAIGQSPWCLFVARWWITLFIWI